MPNKVLLIFLLFGLLAFKTANAQETPAVPGLLTGLLGVVVDVVNVVVQVLQAVVDGLTTKPDCGILNNGQQYYLQTSDGRFAVVDESKEAAYLMLTSTDDASKFTAVEKDCATFGFCVNGFCMSRCEGCTSDSTDFETVLFHEMNSDGGYSQWKLTTTADGLYNLQVDNGYYLTYKGTSAGDQITLSNVLNDQTSFRFVAV